MLKEKIGNPIVQRILGSVSAIGIFLLPLSGATMAMDGPTTFHVKTYASPASASPHRIETTSSNDIDPALVDLESFYSTDFTRNLIINLLEDLDDFEDVLIAALKEDLIGEEIRLDYGVEIKLLDITSVSLKIDPIKGKVKDRWPDLTVRIGDVDLEAEIVIRLTVANQIRIGRCEVTIFAHDLALEVTYSYDPFEFDKAEVFIGSSGSQYVECTGVASMLEYPLKLVSSLFVQKVLSTATKDFADDAESVFSLSDLAGALTDTEEISTVVKEIFETSVDKLIFETPDANGSGLEISVTLEELTDSNVETIVVEALSPSLVVHGEQYTTQTYDYPPASINKWVRVIPSPRLMEIKAAPSTKVSLFLGKESGPTPPNGSPSSSETTRWYALGSNSDEIESVWSRPQYIFIQCAQIGFDGICFPE